MEVFYRVPEVVKEEYGFALDVPKLGQSFKAFTTHYNPAQHHLAEVEQTLYVAPPHQARLPCTKGQRLTPLGGLFNPYLDNERDTPPISLSKQTWLGLHGLRAAF